jgi:ureidoglycolate hydrolase
MFSRVFAQLFRRDSRVCHCCTSQAFFPLPTEERYLTVEKVVDGSLISDSCSFAFIRGRKGFDLAEC